MDKFPPSTQIYNQYFNIKNCFTSYCNVSDPGLPIKILTTSTTSTTVTNSQQFTTTTTNMKNNTANNNTLGPFTNNQNKTNSNFVLFLLFCFFQLIILI